MESLIVGAQRALADAGGAPVRLEAVEWLRDEGRNRVARARVVTGPPGASGSVIVKACLGDEEHPFDLADDAWGSPAWRLRNEWAGTAFLTRMAPDPLPSPRFLAGDLPEGLVVLEDFGSGEDCLAVRLQGDDPDAAVKSLRAYAEALARMHAATAGKEASYRELRAGLGGAREESQDGTRWRREAVPPFQAICAHFGVAPGDDLDADLDAVAAEIDAPGPFLAFTPGDCCPDNHRLLPDGTVRLFDFEFAGFRHALLDAAYLVAPFPTCWCIGRLPGDARDEALAAYRGVFDPDSDGFDRRLAAAVAFWTVQTMVWGWERWREEDSHWGRASIRQRHLLRLETFSACAGRAGTLSALVATADRLRAALAAAWPDVVSMPLYPPWSKEKPHA